MLEEALAEPSGAPPPNWTYYASKPAIHRPEGPTTGIASKVYPATTASVDVYGKLVGSGPRRQPIYTAVPRVARRLNGQQSRATLPPPPPAHNCSMADVSETFDDIDRRHTQILSQLEELNEQIEAAIAANSSQA